MAESNLTNLFSVYQEMENPPIIELQDCNRKPVGAIYLRTLKNENISILTANKTSEKYYLYVNGIAIYFTYFKQIQPENTV